MLDDILSIIEHREAEYHVLKQEVLESKQDQALLELMSLELMVLHMHRQYIQQREEKCKR